LNPQIGGFFTLFSPPPQLRFERLSRCVVMFTITLAILFVSSANRNFIFGRVQENKLLTLINAD